MRKVKQQIINEGRSKSLIEAEGKLINKLEERRQQEEILWKRKSRIQWLKDRERNSRFLHKAIIQYR